MDNNTLIFGLNFELKFTFGLKLKFVFGLNLTFGLDFILFIIH